MTPEQRQDVIDTIDAMAYEADKEPLLACLAQADRCVWLQSHYDAAGPDHNLLALLDLYADRAEKAEQERDELRAKLHETTLERDAEADAVTSQRAEIKQLRADLARVTAERDEAIAIYSVSDHQRDEACRDRDRAMAERDVARADIARMDRALADERAAVVIAHERMDALAAERDDFRKRINEIRAHVPEEWDGDSGDFAGTVVAILSCPHGEPGHYWKDGCPECCAVEHEALRAHAAGSGGSTP